MTTAVGMPLFFSLRIIRERAVKLTRWPIEILGVPLLIAWFLVQPASPVDGPSIVTIRWLLLLAALHFFAALSPYISNREGAGFWQFNRRLFLRFCLATLYTGVLTVGFELALLSADKLFELKLNNAYGDLFFLMIGCFHPAFFLAGVPRDFAALDTDTEYPRGLKAFTQFALAPLVAVYTVILYAYAVKIVITRSWPHGWVALPVLLLSGIGILAFLLLFPLRARAEERWAIWFTKIFPRALAPLAILLLLSLRLRIADYGVTEERYLGVVVGIWIFAWAILFIFKRGAGIRWIPYSLAAICLLAAFGPWSAGAISKTSQLRRIQHILQAQNLWATDHARKSDHRLDLPDKDDKDLESTLTYLIQVHGARSLQQTFAAVLPNEDWDALSRWGGAREVIGALAGIRPTSIKPTSFRPFSSSAPSPACSHVYRNSKEALDLKGFRRMWRVPLYGGLQSEWYPFSYDDIKVGQDHGTLKLATAEEPTPQEIPLGNLFDNLKSKDKTNLPDAILTVDFHRGHHLFRMVFDSISFETNSPILRIESCSFFLLEK
jgi:hypothetical protein